MTCLLDTDTLIYMMRGLKIELATNERQRQWQAAGNRILITSQRAKQAGHKVGLSALTVAELEFGARNSVDYAREMAVANRIISPFTRFDFDATDCAFQYGNLRATLENQGKTIGPIDTLIAAHALALGATLVTNNLGEFSRVPGLKCQNWVG